MALGIALTEFAGMGRSVEAARVGVHKLNHWARDSCSARVSVPIACLIIDGHEGNAGSTATAHLAHIDIKLDCSSEVPMLIWPGIFGVGVKTCAVRLTNGDIEVVC